MAAMGCCLGSCQWITHWQAQHQLPLLLVPEGLPLLVRSLLVPQLLQQQLVQAAGCVQQLLTLVLQQLRMPCPTTTGDTCTVVPPLLQAAQTLCSSVRRRLLAHHRQAVASTAATGPCGQACHPRHGKGFRPEGAWMDQQQQPEPQQ